MLTNGTQTVSESGDVVSDNLTPLLGTEDAPTAWIPAGKPAMLPIEVCVDDCIIARCASAFIAGYRASLLEKDYTEEQIHIRHHKHGAAQLKRNQLGELRFWKWERPGA